MAHRPNGRLVLAILLLAGPTAAQEGPRSLFPAPPLIAAPMSAASPPPLVPEVPIQVENLAAPTLANLGLPAAEAELGGPLWTSGAPPDLALLLSRLPSRIADPTLVGLQRAILLAPGPAADFPRDLYLLRVDRLLAMAEPVAALDLLALVPEGSQGPEVEARRLQARLAADQIEPACAMVGAQAGTEAPWPQARVVCAALAKDASAVQLGLDLLDARGEPPGADLSGLAQAQVSGQRFTLRAALPDDATLLPLLRRVPIDIDPALAATLPLPARRALADNPGLASAARAEAAGAPRPGPSVRPEFAGRAPTDWSAAMAEVPLQRRPRWLALADGLGLDVPEAVWADIYRASADGSDPAPDLSLWRGFELARLAEQRGTMLLYVLLLLDGRPEAAAPVTLRRALDALMQLGLGDSARALAAGTGGALGL